MEVGNPKTSKNYIRQRTSGKIWEADFAMVQDLMRDVPRRLHTVEGRHFDVYKSIKPLYTEICAKTLKTYVIFSLSTTPVNLLATTFLESINRTRCRNSLDWTPVRFVTSPIIFKCVSCNSGRCERRSFLRPSIHPSIRLTEPKK